MMSTIHTSSGLKLDGSWSSEYMKWFVVLASTSFVFTMIIGVILAFKYGRSIPALLSLAAGVLVPVLFVILFSTAGR